MKELRFTRARQAIPFAIGGAVCLGLAGVLFALSRVPGDTPMPWQWALLPLLGAWGGFWLARHLTKHAYLLLSPIGIEIFPFYRPSLHMQLISWSEIKDARISEGEKFLTLQYVGCEDAGVVISLAPLSNAARGLLVKAITGVMKKRAAGAESKINEE